VSFKAPNSTRSSGSSIGAECRPRKYPRFGDANLTQPATDIVINDDNDIDSDDANERRRDSAQATARKISPSHEQSAKVNGACDGSLKCLSKRQIPRAMRSWSQVASSVLLRNDDIIFESRCPPSPADRYVSHHRGLGHRYHSSFGMTQAGVGSDTRDLSQPKPV
jgi:hypothetical protein